MVLYTIPILNFYGVILGYSPYLILKANLSHPYKSNLANSIVSNFKVYISTPTSDRLKYYRHKNCFSQSYIAKVLGISACSYKSYEALNRFYYDVDKLQILADLYKIHITDLLDGYNLFLYNGQGEQIRKKRQAMNLSQLEFGKLLGVGRRTIGKWENDESTILKGTWEKIMGIES